MKKYLILMVLFIMTPSLVLAYSERIILGGENIGIKITPPGVMIIGFYRVNGEFPKSSQELKIGDYIIKVGDKEINTIDDLTTNIEKEEQNGLVDITIKRDNELLNTTITLTEVDGLLKSGLYVKDGITGLGTITYIDPETNIYGALGHEIQESSSSKRVEVKEGFIFESIVESIRKSVEGRAGEKNATYKTNHLLGDIHNNTQKGIYGIYSETKEDNTIEVANINDIKLGPAEIYTVLEGNKKEKYEIEITSINEKNKIKNFYFTVTDNKLIKKAGGIIQGMSGSPITQNNKIIGAVTHVVVEEPIKGYGIFIRNMLEEGDKIKNNQ